MGLGVHVVGVEDDAVRLEDHPAGAGLDDAGLMSRQAELGRRADDPIERVMSEMGDLQVRRLPVLDANNEIVGIVALADIATRQSAHTDETLREISTPGR